MFGRNLTTQQAAAKVNTAVEKLLSGLNNVVDGLDTQVETLSVSTTASNRKIEELQTQVVEEEKEQAGMEALSTRIKKITSNLRTLLVQPEKNSDNTEESN